VKLAKLSSSQTNPPVGNRESEGKGLWPKQCSNPPASITLRLGSSSTPQTCLKTTDWEAVSKPYPSSSLFTHRSGTCERPAGRWRGSLPRRWAQRRGASEKE
jgi:hypothetical protein